MCFDHAGSRRSLPRLHKGRLGCLVLLLMSFSAHPQPAEHGAHSDLDFASSDARLVDSFRCATQQALSYVVDNDPVGPWRLPRRNSSALPARLNCYQLAESNDILLHLARVNEYRRPPRRRKTGVDTYGQMYWSKTLIIHEFLP
jgi:hypothetical protein